MEKKRKGRNFFKRFWDAFWLPEMLVLPGQLAFFIFLSIVPTITLIGYACGYLKISSDVIVTILNKTLSDDITHLLVPIVTSTKITPAFFITLGSGYFIASNGMASIIVTSNTIYGIKDSGFFRRRLKAILMELLLVILILFIIIFPLLGDKIVLLLEYVNFKTTLAKRIIEILTKLSSPISWLIMFILIKVIYTIAPDKKVPSRTVNGGAFFTTVSWVGITWVYRYYIENYANYSAFYGTLANIVIILIWLWLLSYAFVIGMAMNSHVELEKTGYIDVQEVIKESAESAPVLPEEELNKKNKKKNKKSKEEQSEEINKTEEEPNN